MERWELVASVVSAKGLKQGSSPVSVRLRCAGSTFKPLPHGQSSPGVRRQGNPPSVHFDTETVFVKDVCNDGDETILEVRLAFSGLLRPSLASFAGTTTW